MRPAFSLLVVLLFLLAHGPSLAVAQQPHRIEVGSEVIADIDSLFYGIQYHRNTYGDPTALDKLAQLPLRYVRVWAYPSNFHSKPGGWDWEDLDRQLDEITAAGYEPIVCLFQAENWYTGSPEHPWWLDADAQIEWQLAADSLAARYHDRVDWWIIFDEVNYLHPSRPYYMSFAKSVDLYLQAASRIQSRDQNAFIGGPSGFAGWENGHWAANYLLNEPGGAGALDFISSNIFLSWNGDDTDEAIMDRTIWYEEAATKMREMVGDKDNPLLVLDAYNASALWTVDGNPDSPLWTDPRNVNTFGGVYQTAALLHAAKGGFDMTLRWETLGGYGILRWYPEFAEQAPYFAFQLLTGPGSLLPESQLLEVSTTEPLKPDLPHHSGQQAEGYRVQPFAIKHDGGLSVILVNKYADAQIIEVPTPAGYNHYTLFRFDETRHENVLEPVDSGQGNIADLALPGLSVTVIAYPSTQVSNAVTDSDLPQSIALHANYPNPFAATTTLSYTLSEASPVTLTVFNVLGQPVAHLVDGMHAPGTYTVLFDAADLVNGVYTYRLETADQRFARTMLVVR